VNGASITAQLPTSTKHSTTGGSSNVSTLTYVSPYYFTIEELQPANLLSVIFACANIVDILRHTRRAGIDQQKLELITTIPIDLYSPPISNAAVRASMQYKYDKK